MYHQRFTRFKPATVNATKVLMRGWRDATADERLTKAKAWVEEVAALYGMRTPQLVLNPRAGQGHYQPWNNEIHMAYMSIVTLIHEFRHAMQVQRGDGRGRDPEDDARAWSLSLYYRTAPRAFVRLARAGEILFCESV